MIIKLKKERERERKRGWIISNWKIKLKRKIIFTKEWGNKLKNI